MRIVFFGTPAFSLPSLEKLNSTQEVVAVFTQPDRPAGRGLKTQPSPVKEKAIELGLSFYQPDKLDSSVVEIIKELKAILGVVVAYGKLIPENVIKAFPEGIINYHPSLLPKYRGAAPIQRAILNDEKVTGGSVIYLTSEMDAGDILWQEKIEIQPNEDSGSLSKRLSELGAKGLVETIRAIEEGQAKPTPQDSKKATFAPKIEKEELKLNWKEPAKTNWLKVRAFSPHPGAYFTFRNKIVKVYQASLNTKTGKPGEIITANPKLGLEIACDEGSLKIEKVKPEGSSFMTGEEFVRGYRVEEGEILF